MLRMIHLLKNVRLNLKMTLRLPSNLFLNFTFTSKNVNIFYYLLLICVVCRFSGFILVVLNIKTTCVFIFTCISLNFIFILCCFIFDLIFMLLLFYM